MKYVRHTTKAAAVERIAAIDKAIGYPAAATVRGASCPAHPFGKTTTFASPVRVKEGEWATPEAPTAIVGRVERVDGRSVVISNEGASRLYVTDVGH